MTTQEERWRRAAPPKSKINGRGQECPARDLVRELILWFIDDVLDELGSRREVEYAFKILEEGTSADRQLATFKRTNSMNAVVDQLIAETAEGVRT